MVQAPKVSVIMPAYNAESYLPISVGSVQKQTCKDWELLIAIDAKSSDATERIAKGFAEKDSRIRILTGSGLQHVAANRNEALRTAGGQFIAFLDADDIWDSTKLEEQIAFMEQEGCHFSYHAVGVVDQDGQALGISRPVPPRISYSDLLKDNNTNGCLAVVLDRRKFGDLVEFESSEHEDYLLWLKLLQTIPYAQGLTKRLGWYRVNRASRSGNKFRSAVWRWHIYRRRLGMGLLSSLYYFFHYVFSGLKKTRFE